MFFYCLARAADKTGVVLHAFSVLSNHIHVVLTDPNGRLPEFTHWLFEYTSKCVNASLGRWENLWSSEPPSAVRLESIEDTIDKILYVMANPTAAALVPKAEQWPGALCLPKDYLSGPVEVARPDIFFRNNGPTPAMVKLSLAPPSEVEGTAEAFVEMLSDELELRERDIRLQHKQAGRPILGRRAVLGQDPFSYPLDKEPRRNLNPRIACRDKWTRIEAIKRLKQFYADYYDALAVFLAGVRDVVFPAGTYWMVKHAEVRCASPW